MAEVKLTANRGGTPGGVTIQSGTTATGYALLDAVDWGNYDPDLVYSIRKDGSSTATDYMLPPRQVAIPVRTLGTSYDTAVASIKLLGKEVAACVRSGGVLRYKSNVATYPVYLNVRGARFSGNPVVSNRFEIHYRSDGLLSLTCDPAAVGDAMSFRDDFATDTSTSWTQDAGAFTISQGVLSYGSNGAKRARHTARGYAYADVQVTVKITTGSTVASADFAVMARTQGTADTALIGRIQGSATNLLSFATVKAGTIATLSSTAFTPAINTNYWLRLRLEGAVGTVEVFTSEPKPLDAAAFSVTSTLTATDQQVFVSGMCGIRTTLVAFATERFDDFDVRPYTYRLASPEVVRLTGIPGDLPPSITSEVTVPSSLATQAVFGGVFWAERQRQINLCWNGNLEQTAGGNTVGWFNTTVAGVITAAGGAGPTRTTSAAKFGTASVEFVTTAVANQGLNFPMPRRFKKGRTHVAIGWFQSAAGVGSSDLLLGANGDLGTTIAAALSASFTFRSCVWSPTADRDIAYLAPRHVAATAETVRVDGLGVFEVTPQTQNGGINNSTTTMVLTAAPPEGTPATPFVMILEPGAANQELVRVTAVDTAGTTLTIDRGWDGTTAASHATLTNAYALPGYWFDAFSDGAHGTMLDVIGVGSAYGSLGSPTVMSADATARSGFKLLGGSAVTTTAGGFLLDPSSLTPADFTNDELLVEVWLRYMVDANAPSPRFSMYVNGEDGSSVTPIRYDLENGSGGLAVLSPTGASRRFARLGVVSIRYSDVQQRRRIQMVVRYDITSVGTAVSFDYVMLVPAGQRATSPTGRLDDSAYPDFLLGTSTQQTRRVWSDLVSEVGASREQFSLGNLNPGGGIIGAPLVFGAPNSDVMVKLSNVIPNGGTVADAAESLSLASDATITASFSPTPRFLTLR